MDQYLATARAAGPLTPIRRTTTDGRDALIAEGYEWTEPMATVVQGVAVRWDERRLLVRSLTQAQTAATALRKRLERAQAALDELTVRRKGKRLALDGLSAVQTQVDAILKRFQVAEILEVRLSETVTSQVVRAYRGRPAEVRETRQIQLTHTVNPAAQEAAMERLGWRVYVTTQPAAELPLAQAVLAYREEYLIERGMGRLKGAALSLTPLYLTREDHVVGLVRLLSIGLRVLTLLEGMVRRGMAETQERLAGLYAGQPTRTTTQPSAEQLLRAFRGMTLSIITEPHQQRRHMTPLSPLQQRILALLGCLPTIYTDLTAQSP
jgi:transposase